MEPPQDDTVTILGQLGYCWEVQFVGSFKGPGYANAARHSGFYNKVRELLPPGSCWGASAGFCRGDAHRNPKPSKTKGKR